MSNRISAKTSKDLISLILPAGISKLSGTFDALYPCRLYIARKSLCSSLALIHCILFSFLPSFYEAFTVTDLFEAPTKFEFLAESPLFVPHRCSFLPMLTSFRQIQWSITAIHWLSSYDENKSSWLRGHHFALISMIMNKLKSCFFLPRNLTYINIHLVVLGFVVTAEQYGSASPAPKGPCGPRR